MDSKFLFIKCFIKNKVLCLRDSRNLSNFLSNPVSVLKTFCFSLAVYFSFVLSSLFLTSFILLSTERISCISLIVLYVF